MNISVLDQISSLSKAFYYDIIFVNFAVSTLNWIRQQHIPLPPPVFTSNLITVILLLQPA